MVTPEEPQVFQKGQVKWFDKKRGFGFIVNGEGQDVFVHYTVIEGEGFRFLRNGEQVEFWGRSGPKGLQAVVVKRLATSGSTTDEFVKHELGQ